MGSWKHWIRNVEPLATRVTVHALDHPAYGASASVENAPEVNRLLLEFYASGAP
jgi:hypothetical protein